MIEKYTLDNLNNVSVSVMKQFFVEHEGEIKEVGVPWRRAYMNTEEGKAQILNELPKPQVDAILSIWGVKESI